jgi:hypothetical protein
MSGHFFALQKEQNGTRPRLPAMRETLATLVADSCQIAWDYHEATGELGCPGSAAIHLLDAIETMIRCGERRRLLRSNNAISAYQHFRAEQPISLAS